MKNAEQTVRSLMDILREQDSVTLMYMMKYRYKRNLIRLCIHYFTIVISAYFVVSLNYSVIVYFVLMYTFRKDPSEIVFHMNLM